VVTSAAATTFPNIWIADFRRLYNFADAERADLTVPATNFNKAMRIDTKARNPLRTIPVVSEPAPENSRVRKPAAGEHGQACWDNTW
jgi:hypothetical protein